MIRPTNSRHRRDGDRDRHILARDVHNRIRIRGHLSRHRELQRAIPRLRVRDDGQRAKGGEVDTRQRLRTRARNDEHLNCSKGKARRSTRQEWRGRWSLLLRETIEAHLLAFLGQNGADQWHQRALVTTVGGEDGLRLWKRSENDVGEGLRQGYGLDEAGDWEFVLAGFDSGVVGIREDPIHSQGMQFLLL